MTNVRKTQTKIPNITIKTGQTLHTECLTNVQMDMSPPFNSMVVLCCLVAECCNFVIMNQLVPINAHAKPVNLSQVTWLCSLDSEVFDQTTTYYRGKQDTHYIYVLSFLHDKSECHDLEWKFSASVRFVLSIRRGCGIEQHVDCTLGCPSYGVSEMPSYVSGL